MKTQRIVKNGKPHQYSNLLFPIILNLKNTKSNKRVYILSVTISISFFFNFPLFYLMCRTYYLNLQEWKVNRLTFKDNELSLKSTEITDTSGLLSGTKEVKMSKYDMAFLFLPLLKEKYSQIKEVHLSKNAITLRIQEKPDNSGEWKTEVWEFQSIVKAGSNKYFLIQNTNKEKPDSAYLIVSDKNILLGNHVMEINLIK